MRRILQDPSVPWRPTLIFQMGWELGMKWGRGVGGRRSFDPRHSLSANRNSAHWRTPQPPRFNTSCKFQEKRHTLSTPPPQWTSPSRNGSRLYCFPNKSLYPIRLFSHNLSHSFYQALGSSYRGVEILLKARKACFEISLWKLLLR